MHRKQERGRRAHNLNHDGKTGIKLNYPLCVSLSWNDNSTKSEITANEKPSATLFVNYSLIDYRLYRARLRDKRGGSQQKGAIISNESSTIWSALFAQNTEGSANHNFKLKWKRRSTVKFVVAWKNGKTSCSLVGEIRERVVRANEMVAPRL